MLLAIESRVVQPNSPLMHARQQFDLRPWPTSMIQREAAEQPIVRNEKGLDTKVHFNLDSRLRTIRSELYKIAFAL